MPILGVIASSTRQGQATDTGAMFPIFTRTIGITTVSEINFTNIPSTYTHLQIRLNAFYTSSFGGSFMQLNGVTSGSYCYNYLGRAGAATVVSGSAGNEPYIFMGNTAQVNGYSLTHVIDILDYKNTNKLKSVKILSGVNPGAGGAAPWVGLLAGALTANTNAITSVRLYSTAGNFNTHTTATLYGIL